jgi:hypothetical protein
MDNLRIHVFHSMITTTPYIFIDRGGNKLGTYRPFKNSFETEIIVN